MGTSVFVSYSRRDSDVVRRLVHRLRDVGLDPWFDEESIVGGDAWVASLEDGINNCDTMLVLIGPLGLGPFQTREYHVGVSRPRLIPVLLPGAVLNAKVPAFLKSLHAVYYVDESEEAFAHIVASIEGRPPGPGKLRVTLKDEDNPFRGLKPFREEDASFFFGRERDVDRLLKPLREGQRLIHVVGASGTGKSSLIRAGVVPAIKCGALGKDTEWRTACVRPGSDPCRALASALVKLSRPEGITPDKDVVELYDMLRSRDDALTIALSVRLSDGQGLLLVVDQLEELFTLTSDTDCRRAFARNLNKALDGAEGCLRVLTTLRADFCASVLGDPDLAPGFTRALETFPSVFAREQIEQMIRGPADMVGLEFEASVVSRLIEEVKDQPGNLPLLEFTLDALWEVRDGTKITWETYESMGGVADAIARRADFVYEGFDEAGKTAIRRVFRRLIQFDNDVGSATVGNQVARSYESRRQATEEELRAAVNGKDRDENGKDVVKEFVEARLLTVGDGGVVEVAHEAVIHVWTRLRDWIQEDRDVSRIQQELSVATKSWIEKGKDEAWLWWGARLTYNKQKLLSGHGSPTEKELEFLTASERAEEEKKEEETRRAEEEARRAEEERKEKAKRQSEEEMRRASELTRRAEEAKRLAEVDAERERQVTADQRRLTRRARIFAMIAFALAIVAFALAIVAFALSTSTKILLGSEAVAREEAEQAQAEAEQARAEAERRFADSEAYRLANLADQLRESEPMLSLALARQAMENVANGVTRTALLRSLSASRELSRLTHEQGVRFGTWGPDGRVLTVTTDGTARMWNVDGDEPAVVWVFEGIVRQVIVGPDGRAFVIYKDGVARVWKLDGDEPAVVWESADNIRFASWGPDGRVLLIYDDGVARVWNVDEDHSIADWVRPALAANGALGPDGRVLISSADGSARVWSLDNEASTVVSGPEARMYHSQFGPDGRLFLYFFEGFARVWNLDSEDPTVFDVPGGVLSDIGNVWSPDGLLLTVSNEESVQVLNMEGKNFFAVWEHRIPAWSGAWGLDGRQFVVFGHDIAYVGTLDSDAILELRGHQGGITWSEFGPDGRLLTVSKDRTVRIWNLGEVDTVLRVESGSIVHGAWGPDGRVLTVSDDGSARVWNLDGELLTLDWEGDGEITGGAIGPDGRVLTVSNDGSARVWNLDGEEFTEVRDRENSIFYRTWVPGGRILTLSTDGTAQLLHPNGIDLVEDWGFVEAAVHGEWTFLEREIFRDWFSVVSVEAWLLGPDPPWRHPDAIHYVAWSPDGQSVLTAARNGTAYVWTRDRGSPHVLEINLDSDHHFLYLRHVAWSPDGRVLTVSYDSVVVWTLREDGSTTYTPLHSGDATVRHAEWSSDGQRVLTVFTDDRLARVWTLDEGSDPQTIILQGHGGAVLYGTWGPDDRVLTVSEDGTSRVWTLDGEEPTVLWGHNDAVYYGAWSPDGRVLTVSDDGTTRVWILDDAHLIEMAETRILRDFSDEERARFRLPSP